MSTPNNREPTTGRPRRRGERGFNLIELMMSMSLATILFMAVVLLYVRQGAVLTSQNERIDMSRETRFALDHLRRDLMAVGSNTTPHSAVDPLVCPKPASPLRAVTASIEGGYVASPGLNPLVRPTALTLFGSLDVKSRWRTASIDGDKVFLFDDGTLPTTVERWDETFADGRLLRISGADGRQMFFPISGRDFGARSITVDQPIPQIGGGQVCGYTGFGQNYTIDVQNFIRYRVIADPRPGAPLTPSGAVARGVLVREAMATDGTTVKSQLILAENAVDLQIYDVGIDDDPNPEVVKPKVLPLVDDVVQKNGDGLLGNTISARPEALRFLTVKVSVRSEWADADLVHRPRNYLYAPLETWQIANDGRGAHRVLTAGARVAMPTMISRNL